LLEKVQLGEMFAFEASGMTGEKAKYDCLTRPSLAQVCWLATKNVSLAQLLFSLRLIKPAWLVLLERVAALHASRTGTESPLTQSWL